MKMESRGGGGGEACSNPEERAGTLGEGGEQGAKGGPAGRFGQASCISASPVILG